MKKQLKEWKKIFPNHVSDEDLIPKIHKELIKHSNNLILKLVEDLNGPFSKEDI